MKFDYSYRAFLITCLLFGILFLAFKSINLSKYKIVESKSYDVEYNPEEEILTEEELALIPKQEMMQIETNRAFNEAEKFISDLENERQDETESSEEEMKANNAPSVDSNISNDMTGSNGRENEHIPKKDIFSEAISKTPTVTTSNSSKSNSTVSYRLVSRTSLDLPNPVYICDGYGKVVINIEVSATGKVLKASYNNTSSTTTNECLVEGALNYARRAQFTTDSNKPKQLGTITYNFPGQI